MLCGGDAGIRSSIGLSNLSQFVIRLPSDLGDLTHPDAFRHNQPHDRQRTLSVRPGGERDCPHDDGRRPRHVLSNVPLTQ